MKFIYLLFFITFLGFSNVYGQKVKYKQITPLLNKSEYNEALPLLLRYYNQNLVNGEWSTKAILLELNNMNDAVENIAKIYEINAIQNKSSALADSSIYWYNVMIKEKHPNQDLAKNKIEQIQVQIMIWKMEELERIAEQKKIEEQQKQNQYKALYTGENDPLVVARKFASAYAGGIIETMMKHADIENTDGSPYWQQVVGAVNSYKKNKAKYSSEIWKKEVFRNMLTVRLSEDFKITDYKKKNECDQFDNYFNDEGKPLIGLFFLSENTVVVRRIITYETEDNCKYQGNDKWSTQKTIRHLEIYMKFINNQWLVYDITACNTKN